MTDNERPDAGTDVDRAIDLAVREMLDVEPRADLRARVIDDIDRPRRTFTWTWVAIPVAAAAVIVLAVASWPPKEPLVPRALTQIVVRPSDTRVRPPIARREELPNRPRRVRPVAPSDRGIAAAVASADDTVFSTAPPPGFAVVDALAPPPAIQIEQIPASDPPALAGLDVAPLRLPALEVNALPDSPRERHD